MSSVNGSGNSSSSGSRPDDVSRRNREEYQQKESELVKSQQKEIRRISQSYADEIENIKKNHQAQLDNLRGQSREAITSRDMKYQKEMDNVRDLHRKQIQTVAVDTERDKEAYRKSMEGELEANTHRSEAQLQNLKEHFETTLKGQQAGQTDSVNDMREKQAKAIDRQRENLLKASDGRAEALNKAHSQKTEETDRQYRQYRRETTSQLKNQDLKNRQDRQRLSNNQMDQIRFERQRAAQSQEILRDGFQDGLENMRDRFEEAHQKQAGSLEKSRAHLQRDVQGRVGNQMARLENKISDLKESNVQKELKVKSDKEREVRNIRKAFIGNVKDMQNQRDTVLAEANSRTAEDIMNIRDETSKLMQNQNRFYNDKLETQEVRSKEAMQVIESDLQGRNTQLKSTTDMRVKQLVDETNMSNQRLTEYHQNLLETQKNQHATDIKALQINAGREKMEAVERIKEDMRQREIKHAESLNLQKGKYEKQIAELNDQLIKVKRSNDEMARRTVTEMKQSQQMELEKQNMQFQNTLRQMQDQHATEVKTVNKRNEERVDQLVTTLKKT